MTKSEFENDLLNHDSVNSSMASRSNMSSAQIEEEERLRKLEQKLKEKEIRNEKRLMYNRGVNSLIHYAPSESML